MAPSDGRSALTAWARNGLVLTLVLLTACAATPRHMVLPYPDHVRAGIHPGDKVDIVTRDGRSISIVVADVRETSIAGGEHHIEIEDIAALEKHGWTPPRNPCDDGEPLGCSIPRAITLLSDFHDEYGGFFKASCGQHDFCYRYGARTYGFRRGDCDTGFLQSMRRRCDGELKLDPLKRAECRVAAKHLYNNVVRHGEHAFDSGGRYCEYAGPPSSAVAK